MADGHVARRLPRRQHARNLFLGIAIVATLALVGGGCNSGCQTGLQDGVLVAAGTGLSIRAADGVITNVAWPTGYQVRDDGTRALVDPFGTVKAREGDRIQVAGGLGADGVWHACGNVTVEPT